MDRPQNQVLKRDLQAWQILLITLSGIIGVTIFQTSGAILAITGPGGLLTACFIIGSVAILVMEGLSEMIELWPIANAMVEFVKYFVDEDLGTVVGIAYWYTFSSVFATLIIEAASLTEFWLLPKVWKIVTMYCFCPLILLGINFCGVKYFGYVECFAGVMKVTFIIGGAMLLWTIGPSVGSGNIDDGFQNGIGYGTSHGTALCLSLPVLAYGFLGVEIVSVTAFEAFDRRSLRVPAKWIAYVILALYFGSFLGGAIDVKWNSPYLPVPALRPVILPTRAVTDGETSSVLLIAVQEAGIQHLPGFFNACIIFCVISASNTALYVSSRTLFGLARGLNPNGQWPICWLAKLGTTTTNTRVPAWALVVSALAFFWLPFLHLNTSYSIQDLVEIMATTGSVGGLLVWASQCLAFIQYRKWLHIHKGKLTGDYLKYNRWESHGNENRYTSVLSIFQPIVAWLGMIGCLLIVFVFNSANWWSTAPTVEKVAVAYAGPIILLAIWVLIKAVKAVKAFKGVKCPKVVKLDHDPLDRNWLDQDWDVLKSTIDQLENLIAEGDNTLNDTTTYEMSKFHNVKQNYFEK